MNFFKRLFSKKVLDYVNLTEMPKPGDLVWVFSLYYGTQYTKVKVEDIHEGSRDFYFYKDKKKKQLYSAHLYKAYKRIKTYK